jgi:hypothetical protein
MAVEGASLVDTAVLSRGEVDGAAAAVVAAAADVD